MSNNKQLVKFFVAAAIFFIWSNIQGAIQAQKPVHEFLEHGPADLIIGAHVHVGLLGGVFLALMGVFYYLLPQITGKAISWPKLINWIFWVQTVSVALNSLLMIWAGISGGYAFKAGQRAAELDAVMKPFMIPISLVAIVWGLTAVAFSVQIILSARKSAP